VAPCAIARWVGSLFAPSQAASLCTRINGGEQCTRVVLVHTCVPVRPTQPSTVPEQRYITCMQVTQEPPHESTDANTSASTTDVPTPLTQLPLRPPCPPPLCAPTSWPVARQAVARGSGPVAVAWWLAPRPCLGDMAPWLRGGRRSYHTIFSGHRSTGASYADAGAGGGCDAGVWLWRRGWREMWHPQEILMCGHKHR